MVTGVELYGDWSKRYVGLPAYLVNIHCAVLVSTMWFCEYVKQHEKHSAPTITDI